MPRVGTSCPPVVIVQNRVIPVDPKTRQVTGHPQVSYLQITPSGDKPISSGEASLAIGEARNPQNYLPAKTVKRGRMWTSHVLEFLNKLNPLNLITPKPIKELNTLFMPIAAGLI